MFQGFIDLLEKFGALGLFIHGMIDAIIFPIPALFLQIPLSAVHPSDALWLATVGFIGCLIGTPIGYWIGRSIGTPVLYRIVKRSWVDSAEKLFSKNGEAAILLGSFTPIPFKVFTILSGALKFPLWKLLAYAAVGRAVKFYAVGTLFYMYGRSAEGMVKDVSLYIFAIGFPLIVLFLWLRRRWRIKRNRKNELEVEQALTQTQETAHEQNSMQLQVQQLESAPAQELEHKQELATAEEQTEQDDQMAGQKPIRLTNPRPTE
jgi:membrane protein YqaA with SNARE-associated domain